MKYLIFTLALLALVNRAAAQQNVSIDVKKIISELTLEEKVKLLTGAGMKMPGETAGAIVGETEDKVPGAAGTSQEIKRFSLPKIVMADGPAGVRISPVRKSDPGKKFYATGFPVATMFASSFNTPLMERAGSAFGDEAKEYGVDILLSPALNIHRNPLGGRNFEYYSEDPRVSGKMAAAFVRGVQSQGVGATIKHYAANNQETNRNKINTIVSQRALREIYLKGFEIAVKESDPWAVMSSYNKINGTYASESSGLLTTILREEWGFKGFVMTDWFGGENAPKQMMAGNDLLMPGRPDQEASILEAIRNGMLSENTIDRNLNHILTVYARTPSIAAYKPGNKPDLEKHKALAHEAAVEGMVLLKNSPGVLPLSRAGNSAPVALLGIGSYETIAGGTGSGDVNKAYVVSIYEGLAKKEFLLSDALTAKYRNYIGNEKRKIPAKKFFFEPDVIIPELSWNSKQLDSLADVSAAAIFTLTRTSGEFVDRAQTDFELSETEKQIIVQASDAFHKKGKRMIVLLNIGGVIETASWKQHPDAILIVWQPGQEGGHAVADIISGSATPSGKLPMTFPVRYQDTPSAGNFPGKELEPNPSPGAFSFTGVKSEVVYEEDIFVGYRYFDSFNKEVSYPFGSGLSYTNFDYNDLTVSQQPDGNMKVTCVVKNIGEVAGKEVAQFYVSAPKGDLIKPSKELKAFVKTPLLKPGESTVIEVLLTPADFVSFDEKRSAWISDKGEYAILCGRSINDLPLEKKIVFQEEKVILKVNDVLKPERKINTLQK